MSQNPGTPCGGTRLAVVFDRAVQDGGPGGPLIAVSDRAVHDGRPVGC